MGEIGRKMLTNIKWSVARVKRSNSFFLLDFFTCHKEKGSQKAVFLTNKTLLKEHDFLAHLCAS